MFRILLEKRSFLLQFCLVVKSLYMHAIFHGQWEIHLLFKMYIIGIHPCFSDAWLAVLKVLTFRYDICVATSEFRGHRVASYQACSNSCLYNVYSIWMLLTIFWGKEDCCIFLLYSTSTPVNLHFRVCISVLLTCNVSSSSVPQIWIEIHFSIHKVASLTELHQSFRYQSI